MDDMTNGKMRIRMGVDKYMHEKQEKEQSMDAEYMRVVPVDYQNRTVPMGMSAADKTRNLKDVAHDLYKRMCP